jgi:hypothetical protein
MHRVFLKKIEGDLGHVSGNVWERGCGCVPKKFKFFFLLKFNMVFMFWIILMC